VRVPYRVIRPASEIKVGCRGQRLQAKLTLAKFADRPRLCENVVQSTKPTRCQAATLARWRLSSSGNLQPAPASDLIWPFQVSSFAQPKVT